VLNCDNYQYSKLKESETQYSPFSNTSYSYMRPLSAGMTPAMSMGTTGQQYGGIQGTAGMSPASSVVPQTLQSPYYLAGYLKNFIGKEVRIEFLIGTGGPLVDRTGTLLEVGVSYLVIKPVNTDDTLVSDLFSIKFVTIYH
jgi:hypothetical protein